MTKISSAEGMKKRREDLRGLGLHPVTVYVRAEDRDKVRAMDQRPKNTRPPSVRQVNRTRKVWLAKGYEEITTENGHTFVRDDERLSFANMRAAEKYAKENF